MSIAPGFVFPRGGKPYMMIYIVRHGETEWNKQKKTQGAQNIALSDVGREQAFKLGKRLKGCFIKYIYASDLDRALETAKIIGNEINLTPTSSPLLREACFGTWEGLTLEQIEEKYPGQLSLWNQDMGFKAPKGESLKCVLNRVRCFIHEMMEKHTNQDDAVLIVSHALTCKILILELINIPMEYMNRIRLDNASLSLIEFSKKSSRIIFLNDRCHI